MPRFNLTKGRRVRVIVEGHVVSNGGGWFRLSSDWDAEDDEPTGDLIDIVEHMVVGQPSQLGDFPNGTLFTRFSDFGGVSNTREVWTYRYDISKHYGVWDCISHAYRTLLERPAGLKRLYTEDEL